MVRRAGCGRDFPSLRDLPRCLGAAAPEGPGEIEVEPQGFQREVVPRTGTSDDALMDAVAAGSRESMAEIVRRWQAPILRFLERMLGDPSEAVDIAQEVFLTVFEQAPGYHGSGRFKGWLFTVARNKVRSRLRRKAVERIVRFEFLKHERPAPESERPDRQYERKAQRRLLDDAIAHLPPRQREALLLRYMEGFGHAEIAEVMGSSVHAVEGLLQRALKRLRREIGR